MIGCGATDAVCDANFDMRQSSPVSSEPLNGNFVLQPEVPRTLEFLAIMDDLPPEMRVIESIRYPSIGLNATFSYPPGAAPPGQAEFPAVMVEVRQANRGAEQRSSNGSREFAMQSSGQCDFDQDFCATTLRLTFHQEDLLYPALNVNWQATGRVSVAPCFDLPTLPTLGLEQTR
jgi:hypothetical protein